MPVMNCLTPFVNSEAPLDPKLIEKLVDRTKQPPADKLPDEMEDKDHGETDRLRR